MKRILVTGANGLIGSSLIRYLGDTHRVDIVSTNPGKAKELHGRSGDCFTWKEIADDGERLLRRYDVVMNMAGAPMARRWTERYQREIRESRVGLTRMLADRLRAIGPDAPRLLNASATWIYGYHPDPRQQNEIVFDETSALDPYGCDNFVVNVCRAWEEALDDLDPRRVVRLRIGVVITTKGGVFPLIEKYTKLGLGGRVGSGLQPFTWVSLSDTLRAIAHVMDREDLHGPVNIVSPERMVQSAAAKIICSHYRRPHSFGLPALLVRALHGRAGVQMTLNGPQVHPSVLLSSGFVFEDSTLGEALDRGAL